MRLPTGLSCQLRPSEIWTLGICIWVGHQTDEEHPLANSLCLACTKDRRTLQALRPDTVHHSRKPHRMPVIALGVILA